MAGAHIRSMLGEAVRQHQAGQLDRAALIYRNVLAADPGNADALHLLGLIALQTGQAEMAAELTGKAVAIDGRNPSYHFHRALALQTLGDMEGAVAGYRRVLMLKPEDPDAYNNMGNALAAQGKLEEAESAFRRALALQPDNAVLYSNLGNVQRSKRQFDEAQASYRNAIALQPHHIDAIINLGNVHHDKGEWKEAENCYRRAVALAPDSAAAHCGLGLTLWNLGRRDEAIASYRAALACDANHVEALANLGIARWQSGALEEAEAIYTRAVALRPRDPDLMNNFAALKMARGNRADAMDMICRSLAIRETAKAKRLFVDLAQSGWSGSNNAVRGAMVRALTEPWDRPAKLGRASAKLIKSSSAIGSLVARANSSWPARLCATELLGGAGFAPLADDPLLIALLTAAPNTDIALERFLTMLRAAILQEVTGNGSLDGNAERFACALAQQCFINEYIFLPEDAEMAAAKATRAALERADAVAPMQLLIVACYFPLHGLKGSARFLERSWPASVDPVITQQVREPLEEQRLRAKIPRLTAIEDRTSQLVQSQYEENPYPRWVRLAPAAPDNIIGFLSGKFPFARFERHVARPMRDILIAGCGTGQQSISAAQKFGDAHLLAVDLSLTSLAYARRKSEALGLSIAYGQADILELGALGRQFDIIECLGVLHHMADPYAGWKALLALLRPNGFMLVGVYSEAARRQIVKARACIAGKGFDGSAEDIRIFRQHLMQSEDPGVRAAILKSEDFFSVSACRDLLFHVQEHRLALPEIAGFLKREKLTLLGFELADAVLDAFRRRFPDDSSATDLQHWAIFESENPDIFAGMYAFWIQKTVGSGVAE